MLKIEMMLSHFSLLSILNKQTAEIFTDDDHYLAKPTPLLSWFESLRILVEMTWREDVSVK